MENNNPNKVSNNTMSSIIQSAASKFAADRDIAISKINRIFDGYYHEKDDLENELIQQIELLSFSELNLEKIDQIAQSEENKRSKKK